MYLTELANRIGEAINSSLPGNWGGGLLLPADMPVLVNFDPFSEQKSIETAVYITPANNEYDLNLSRRTSQVDALTGVSPRPGIKKRMFVIVSICKPFEAKLDLNDSSNDVTHPTEWSLLKNLQEDLEVFLIHLSLDGVRLLSIDSDPANEVALDQRLYLASITLGYETC
jgi:hypothetical protein